MASARTTEAPFKLLLCLGLFASLSSGCANRRPAATEIQVPAQVQAQDDRLGQGDVFEVRVFGEKDLGGTYQVTGEGVINFPFLGKVEVDGRTPESVGTEIATRLREGGYLVDPHVSVLVTENRSKRVSVIGAVAKAGTFPFAPGMTLVQAISLAGGFSSLADRDHTVVTRREGDKLKRFEVEMDAVARGGRDDFFLLPGDIVFVPERIF